MNSSLINRLLLGLGILFCLGMSSCLEIYENLHFKKDGSGTAEFIYDYSGLMSMMNMGNGENADSSGSDSDNKGDEFWAQLTHTFDSISQVYKTIPGLKNLVYTPDREKNQFSIRYEFTDISVLNAFLNKGSAVDQMAGSAIQAPAEQSADFQHFSWKNGVLHRNYKTMKLPEDDKEMQAGGSSMLESMLSSMTYHLNYTFENGVRKVKGETVNWSKGSDEVSMDYTLDKILKDTRTLAFTVKSK